MTLPLALVGFLFAIVNVKVLLMTLSRGTAPYYYHLAEIISDQMKTVFILILLSSNLTTFSSYPAKLFCIATESFDKRDFTEWGLGGFVPATIYASGPAFVALMTAVNQLCNTLLVADRTLALWEPMKYASQYWRITRPGAAFWIVAGLHVFIIGFLVAMFPLIYLWLGRDLSYARSMKELNWIYDNFPYPFFIITCASLLLQVVLSICLNILYRKSSRRSLKLRPEASQNEELKTLAKAEQTERDIAMLTAGTLLVNFVSCSIELLAIAANQRFCGNNFPIQFLNGKQLYTVSVIY